MAKSDEKTQVKSDEFSRIFDEYRAKIEEITRRSEQNLQPADTSNDKNNNVDDQQDTATVSEEKPEKANRMVEVDWQPDKAAAAIIKEAEKKAQQIIDEAEEKANKEARKKIQTKADKFLDKAKKDAEEIVAQARQEAEKERNGVVSASKREAEQLISEITEKYRQETQTHSSKVIDEARQTAENMLTGIGNSSTEIIEMVMNIVNKARNTIDELENSLHKETDELTKMIEDMQNQLATINPAPVEQPAQKTEPSKKASMPENDNILFVKFTGDKSNGQNDKSPLYCGRIELKALSSFEYNQVRNIKNRLIDVADIKYIQEYASEKEMSVLFEVKKPLPLVDIFKELPSVDKVDTESDGISLTLKKQS